MSRKRSNQLPNNLPQLQNLMKRDPASYKDELEQQLRHFDATRQVFELSPSQFNGDLEEMVMFLAQVAKCYQSELSTYPQTLIDLLKKHSTVLNADMRLALCRALILLRHKGLLAPADLLHLFFDLLRCQDKSLRHFLKDNIVADLKGANANRKDVRLNTVMQNFMFTMLKDAHAIAAKMSLDVMTELYRKGVWRDAKTVNVICEACFSPVNKVMVAAVKFLLGSDGDVDGDGSDDDDDEDDLPSMKEVKMANKVNKKSRKREKFLENVKKAHKRKRKNAKAESFNFSALHMIHDPQGFAEKLFKKMEGLKEKFEIKILFLDLISRLIGTHELLLLSFYPYVSRFLNPHQREVVHMLQFSAQSAHELVPPESMEPVVKAIVNNFVTERNSGEVMAIGLNAVRELAKRCPLALDEALLRDLAAYKLYKDKAVMMAARSLIQLYRRENPELLHKKDRGRPTEAALEMQMGDGGVKRGYGDAKTSAWVAGAEVLEPSDEKETMTLEEKRQKAKEVTESRILSDADFKRIDSAQLRKEVQGFRKGSAKGNRKRKRRQEEEEEEEGGGRGVDDDDEEVEYMDGVERPLATAREELVNLSNIEMVHKKRRHDKESRLATVMEGREGRDKFGSMKGKANEHASTTNKQKLKNKAFMMVKGKFRAKSKKSFVQKQKELKQALIRSRKFK